MRIDRNFYLDKLKNKMHNGKVKIITGIRRCGKSYLLFNIFTNYLLSLGVKNKQLITLALDDIEFASYRNPFKLNEYVRSRIENPDNKYYLLIDEIQYSKAVLNPDVEGDTITFVDTLLSLMKIKNLDIYVTGSNSKMLSRDILTSFRDRGDQIHIYPLSFKELSGVYDDKDEALNDYMLFGGMPYLLSLNSFEEKSFYLKNLFKETYLKDIIERNNILNSDEIFEILLDFISSSVGSLTNPNRIANRFSSEKKIKISNNTITTYLTYLEDAFILYNAKRYDVKGAKYFNTPSKYYFSDIGLRNARLNFRQIDEGHIIENIIYNELISRGYSVDVGMVEVFERIENKTQRKRFEVDFIVNKGNQKFYIQSALNLNTIEKLNQERASLRKINDSFKKIIIVRDRIINRYDEYGIYYIDLKKFLLEDDLI